LISSVCKPSKVLPIRILTSKYRKEWTEKSSEFFSQINEMMKNNGLTNFRSSIDIQIDTLHYYLFHTSIISRYILSILIITSQSGFFVSQISQFSKKFVCFFLGVRGRGCHARHVGTQGPSPGGPAGVAPVDHATIVARKVPFTSG